MNDVSLDGKNWDDTIEFNNYAFSVAFLRAHKELYEALVAGEVEGVPFTLIGGWNKLAPGDTYLAERNAGLQILTVREVDVVNIGCVFPVDKWKYPYNLGECFKVELHIEDRAH